MSISCIRANKLSLFLFTDICLLLSTEANKFLPLFHSPPNHPSLLSAHWLFFHPKSRIQKQTKHSPSSSPALGQQRTKGPPPRRASPQPFTSRAAFDSPGKVPQETWLYIAVTHFPPASQGWHVLRKTVLLWLAESPHSSRSAHSFAVSVTLILAPSPVDRQRVSNPAHGPHLFPAHGPHLLLSHLDPSLTGPSRTHNCLQKA